MKYRVVHQNVGGVGQGEIVDSDTYPGWQFARLVEAGALVEVKEEAAPSLDEQSPPKEASERAAPVSARERAVERNK
jgi:hypothetical protein